ncbi:MAG: hypothetical protein ACPG4X_16895 [Pikeienuella sp.]
MTRRNLPPLEVGTVYRAQDFVSLEFSAQSLHRSLTGEDTAILRLRMENETKLEIPISDDDLKHHMKMLIEAYPSTALEYISERWPKDAAGD